MGTLFQNVRLLKGNAFITMDVLVENGMISSIGRAIQPDGHTVILGQERNLFPGFIDLHVHLREPGFEAKEDIETGTLAAARGGFTTIACMPNTRPPIDSADKVLDIHQRVQIKGSVRVLPIAAITKNQLGEELTDFEAIQRAGVLGLSDDGVGVQSAAMMKRAMEKAKELGLPIIAHCEDNTLAHGGSVHDGHFAKTHDLRGIPSSAEAIHIARDIVLAEETGAHYHVCHISTKASVQLVREAKQRGVHVTAEVTPHHLLLCEDDIPGLDPNYKMNPPLRGREDQEALLLGLLDGTIDFIATDHAPHTSEEKAKGMHYAPFGIVGLETAFPLLYTHLVRKGILSLNELLDKMTVLPADVFQLASGRLQIGARADLVLVDLEEKRKIDPSSFLSKAQNTPFAGWECQGWPTLTMVEGKVVWQAE